jgi:hypothetical protein
MQQAVRQRGLTVINVGDDAEIANVGGVHFESKVRGR